MSWLDDIIDVGSKLLGGGGETGSWGQIGSSLAKTALAGFALNSVTKSINRDNAASGGNTTTENGTATAKPVDPGVRLQVNPSPDHKIPVVYGRACLGGIITDAQITEDNKSMYFCITICEKTGRTNLGAGTDSVISFEDIYWNNKRIIFKGDGITANYGVDGTGLQDDSIQDNIKIWCYNNGSSIPTVPLGYSSSSTTAAYNVMPSWGVNHLMGGLVFVILRMDYSKEKNITGIGDLTFVLNNTMYQAGDCLADYMTNTRYGAGIPVEEIYLS